MDHLQKDRTFLHHAESELKDFLLSDQLFWPLSEGERLTLGSLLLALIRVKAVAKSPDEIQTIERISTHLSDTRAAWRTNWSNKAALEFRSRLRQWELVGREILSGDNHTSIVYHHEVTLRVILALLQPEMLEPDVVALEHLGIRDHQLSAASHRTGFIWDPGLQEQFPEEKFWFLYRNPTQEGKR